ncbi:NADP-reducing hydrogenase subunit HndA [Clostridiales bacterium CHKCI001]|nr:NADP-reducing hydrogenase subunit HndA [Clostridiales bacterium CHKCI001]
MEQVQLEEIVEYYSCVKNPKDQENIVAMLREIQEIDGWISQEAITYICSALELKETFLKCLIQRLPSLKLAPYQHIVTICSGERCKRKGGDIILNTWKEILKPDQNGISKDQVFCLRVRNCLKHCTQAPSFQVDEKLYSNVKPSDIRKIIENYRSKKGTSGTNK